MGKKESENELIRDLLRSKELRATPARISVTSYVTKSSHPVTHLEVADKLTKSGFDKSTIFRALNDLTEAGLFKRMELGDHVWRYERVDEDDAKHAAHPHLLCVDCGSVQCLSDSQVELKTSKSLGRIEDVLLKGHCKECQ
jgi:Fur family ferric uptake transcriptional regulator